MIRSTVCIALVALALAGCDGGGDAAGTATDAAGPTVGQPNGAAANRCASLTVNDIARVASVQPADQQALASAPGQSVRCSTVFIDSSGQLILQLSEAGGGRAALAALRRTTASDLGPNTVRPLPALGEGAFVARRVLAYARGRALVELQTGYSADGRLQLTPDQLARLAEIVG
jgi:hypothetical protein